MGDLRPRIVAEPRLHRGITFSTCALPLGQRPHLAEERPDRRQGAPVHLLLRRPLLAQRARWHRERVIAALHDVERAPRGHPAAHPLQEVERAEPVARPLHEQHGRAQGEQHLVAERARRAAERVPETDERVHGGLERHVAADAAPHRLARQHDRTGAPLAGVGEGRGVRGDEHGEAIRRSPARDHVRIVEAHHVPERREPLRPA